MNKRDNVFDVMKGISILAMVIGHSTIPKLLERFIFVWHIPLFFLVSGYFYKPKPIEEYVRKNARQLLLPYIFTSVVLILLTAVKYLATGKGDTLNIVIAAIVGNGTVNNPTFSEYSIGAIWFLLAMFWCRVIYNTIQFKINGSLVKGGAVLIISIIATYVGSMLYVPSDILEGMEALLFFYIGHLAHQYKLLENHINSWFVLIVFVLTGLSIYSGSMSMVRCHYGYWPINYLAAIGMTILVYHFSKRLNGNHFLMRVGRISIVILCVHIVELTFMPMKFIHENISLPNAFDVLIHLLVAVVGSIFILRFGFVRNLFSIK